jgi:hypothetical protein
MHKITDNTINITGLLHLVNNRKCILSIAGNGFNEIMNSLYMDGNRIDKCYK